MHPEAKHTLCVAEYAMAEALGMTPLEFYRKILRTDDMRNPDNDRPMTGAAMRLALERANEVVGYEEKYHEPGTKTLPDGRLHGVGIACMNDRHGGNSGARGVVIYMNNDGSANFVTGQSNNQNGANSVTIANVVAETIGIKFESAVCTSYGTGDQAPDGGMQAGSTGAISNCSAAFEAAMDIREQLFTYAAEQLEVAVEDLHARDGKIFVKTDPSKEITHAAVMARISKPIIGVGKNYGGAQILRKPFQGKEVGDTAYHRSGVASAWEVAVDPETGEVEILKHSHIYDIGRIVDPYCAGGQLSAAFWSQWAKVMCWDIKHDPQTGALLSQTQLDNKTPTTMDLDDSLNGGEFLETKDAAGPYGMHGCGEPGAQGTGPAALSMAIHNAIGGDIQLVNRPTSPAGILKLLGKA